MGVNAYAGALCHPVTACEIGDETVSARKVTLVAPAVIDLTRPRSQRLRRDSCCLPPVQVRLRRATTLISQPKSEFRPVRLLSNGHVQTLAGIFLPHAAADSRGLGTTSHVVPLDDGDRIVLHENCPADWRPTDPNVLLVHGLCGCHASGYMLRMMRRLVHRRVRVFRMDLRGCGAGEGLAQSPTHCLRIEDAQAALNFIARCCPDSATRLVGFSLGGAITLNLLGEIGASSVGNLEAAIAVCPPIDLVDVESRLNSWVGRPYNRFFARNLWKQLLRKHQLTGEPLSDRLPGRLRWLHQYDQHITAPLGGFASADQYYRQASPGRLLSAIRLPTLIIATEDDPIIPIQPLQRSSCAERVEVLVTRRGGHLGFLGRRNGDPDRRWLDWRIIDWLLGYRPDSCQSAPNQKCR